MSFSTEWDIDKYHVGYESEEHWELRKKFLLQHKNQFPEEKLVCLAQVFYNVEFLGCRYPKATMKMVESLSKGVVEDHREKMKNRLKRTFVGASDAASSKVKGLKRPAAGLENITGNSNTPSSNPYLMQSKHIKFELESENPLTVTSTDSLKLKATTSKSAEPRLAEQTEQTPPPTMLNDQPTTSKKKKKKKKKSNNILGNISLTNAVQPPSPTSFEASSPAMSSVSTSSKFQNIVLYFREEDNAREKIQSSCMFSKVPFEFSSEFLDKLCVHQCIVKVGGVGVGSGTGTTASLAQESAASAAVNCLSKHCYTILVKNPFVAVRKVERREIMDCQPGSSEEAEAVSDKKASRMMKMMGWSGGGLGKEEQGRTEPVLPVHQSRRAGVGSTTGKIKLKNLKKILLDFMESGSTHDVVFSTDFDNEERKEIHTIAHRFGLKSQSRSKGENRFLVISRKWNSKELLSVLRDSRSKSEKYRLLPPNSSEEVAAVSQHQRTEESHLRVLVEERAKVVSEEQRALADQAIASQEYEKKLSELEEEMNKHREAAIMSEVDKKVLDTLRDPVAQKDNELVVLRREKQWGLGAELFCGPASVNSVVISQISDDVKEASKELEELENEFQQLHCKRTEADKIMNKVRAYTETEKNAKLDMECRISAIRVERRKRKEAALSAHRQIQQILPIRVETMTSLKHSEIYSVILKELEEEKICGGNLMKEICEVMQLAAKYTTERQEWLKKQFPQDPSENSK